MAEKLEDLNLPNAVVTRIIKEAINSNVMIGKEARTALGRAASVFVLYVTSAATNISRKSNRKTTTGQDVLDAMAELEFDVFVAPLTAQLEHFRKAKKDAKGKKKTDAEQAGQEPEHDDDLEMIEDDDEELA